MKTSITLALVIALMMWVGSAAQTIQLGVIARVPVSFSVQLTFPPRFAIEAGIATTGPAVFAAKLYLQPWLLGKLSLVPAVGLGGAIAFLPGDLIAWGAYALAGLELPIPKTRLSLLADLVLVLPLPVGTGTFHVGPQVGVRLDF
ncbi:hypothetical protein KKG90_09645 [Candidatus Bipolaricaulota bacterium]|nr:hypothetical protein [Candidatus Bipolaricaulota bacterium]